MSTSLALDCILGEGVPLCYGSGSGLYRILQPMQIIDARFALIVPAMAIRFRVYLSRMIEG